MLKEKKKSIQQIVNEQVKQWINTVSPRQAVPEKEKEKEKEESEPFYPCITISRQRGSGGWLIGRHLAEQLSFKLFDSEILNEISRDLKISRKVLQTIDEQTMTKMELWISRLFRNKFIEPDEFQQKLVQTVLSIAEHGRAIFVGRGAHAIIPAEKNFRLRFIAPVEIRVQNIARELNLSEDQARFDVLQKDRERETFLRREFDINVDEELNFDLIINTQYFTIDQVVPFLMQAYHRRFNLGDH